MRKRLVCGMFLVMVTGLGAGTAWAGVSFADPAGGWTYLYTGDQCLTPFAACLDGKWHHYDAAAGGSDAWDGSAPGQMGAAGVKPSPGGAGVFKEGDIGFLRIQDPGDPRAAPGGGWADPGNRKITFTHNITTEVAKPTTILDDGVTLTFRARIPTTPPLDPLYPANGGPNPWVTSGYNIHDDGYGAFGIKQGTSGLGCVCFSLAMDTDEGDISGNGLTMNKRNGTAVTANVDSYDSGGTENTLTGFDPTQWHEFWIQIVKDTSGGGTHRVTLWRDGDVANPRTFHVSAGTKSEDAGGGWSGYLVMSLGRTTIAGSQDVDFFGYKPGLLAPVAARDFALAWDPSPADKKTDVLADTILAWQPSDTATGHDVYFGTDADAVSKASAAEPKGVLVSRGQSGTTFAPANRLQYGKTYYWRVDEIGAAPASAVSKGVVWSFTVEPFSVPITALTATASSAQADMGPENTINGSGLNALDQHSTEAKEMWLGSGVQPNWIQFAFDKPYKLDKLLVWNSNQMIESFIGFGAKSVTVECSTDGSTWTPVPNVPEFARATGLATYTANTTVNLTGVLAQYVKLTINSTWGGMPQGGLSEVRFFYIPVQAGQPVPASGATGVDLEAALSWRPGHEAASHKVYFSTDANAVANGTAPSGTAASPSYQPASLQFGTTYYWKVAEVNEAATPSTWESAVWSFTTTEYASIDDFESYNDADNRIYDTWIDGYTDGKSNSFVGYPVEPFAEQTILHGGKQSMPFEYNNIKTPYYSEAERTWDKAQNWTGSGADTLVLYFQGRPVSFLEKSAGNIVIGGGGADIFGTADQFRFGFKRLTGNGTIVARVDSIGNTDPWAKAGVMIRESLEAGSRYAIVLASPGNGVRFQARAATDTGATSDTTVATAAQTALKTPVWVKLERSGMTFNGYYSTDGVKWTPMSWNPQTINMVASPVYIGLAVTSHNAAALTTAEFSGVAMTGTVTGSWESQAIGVAQPSNTPGQLYVMVQDSAGKSKVVNHPDPLATTLPSWQAWRIPLSDFTAAGVKMTSVKTLVIGVGDRTNPKANGAGMLYIDDIGYGHPASAQ
ncbi:MAG: discoidin domain-containing protein [Phycisphaerae bacterium]|nr:discoidin domain-containing protein [Phycisphaerae bacterium]